MPKPHRESLLLRLKACGSCPPRLRHGLSWGGLSMLTLPAGARCCPARGQTCPRPFLAGAPRGWENGCSVLCLPLCGEGQGHPRWHGHLPKSPSPTGSCPPARLQRRGRGAHPRLTRRQNGGARNRRFLSSSEASKCIARAADLRFHLPASRSSSPRKRCARGTAFPEDAPKNPLCSCVEGSG